MDLDQNRDLGIVSNVILSFAQNGIISSDTLSTAANTPIVIVSKTGIFSDLSKSSLEKRNLNSFSEFNTPIGSSFVLEKDNQDNNNVFNTQTNKRTNTFTFFDENKKAKYNDFNRLNSLTDSVDQMMKKINSLELKVVQLENDNTLLRNQIIDINPDQLKENISQLNTRIILLESRNTENQVEMTDEIISNQINIRSYADLFKVDENKKITEPVHDIINIISNNEQEKRKRELNLIVFGLKVPSDDKEFKTIKKLMNDIGVNNNNIDHAIYLKKKDSINVNAPIKIVAYNINAKFLILKASRKLREYNQKYGTKINISTDMSEIDRQLMKKLIDSRNDLNKKLTIEDKKNFYWGIRDNKLKKIFKKL